MTVIFEIIKNKDFQVIEDYLMDLINDNFWCIIDCLYQVVPDMFLCISMIDSGNKYTTCFSSAITAGSLAIEELTTEFVDSGEFTVSLSS